MNKSKIVTRNQLKELQLELKSIDDKKEQMLKEQKRLTDLFVQQQELTEKIGKFLMDKHTFTTFDEFITWYTHKNSPSVIPVDKTSVKPVNEGKVWKTKNTVEIIQKPVVTKHDMESLIQTLNIWMNSHDLTHVETSQLLDKPDDYIDTLYAKSEGHRTDAQLRNLLSIYTDILNDLNQLDSSSEVNQDISKELNKKLNNIDSWMKSHNLTKSELSKILGKASTYINNLQYKVKNVSTERDAQNLLSLLQSVVEQIGTITSQLPHIKVKTITPKVDATGAQLDKMKEQIDTWIIEHQMTKMSLSRLSGHGNAYLNQQYTKMKQSPTANQRASIAKVLNGVLKFTHQCDNPLDTIDRKYTEKAQFTVAVKLPDSNVYQYYAEEQPDILSEDYLDLYYTNTRYAAKLLDRESVKRFYSNFKDEHPEISITVVPVLETEVTKYYKK